MNIFLFAMKREEEHAKFYRTLAKGAVQPGLKKLLRMLASDEDKHYRIVKAMSKNLSPRLVRTPILTRAQAMFAGLDASRMPEEWKKDPTALLKRARKNEELSRLFYLKKSKEAVSKAHRDLFILLSQEERKHWVLLDNLIEFIARPRTWIENAEFNHLDDY